MDEKNESTNHNQDSNVASPEENKPTEENKPQEDIEKLKRSNIEIIDMDQ